jgi:hypothetical protein
MWGSDPTRVSATATARPGLVCGPYGEIRSKILGWAKMDWTHFPLWSDRERPYCPGTVRSAMDPFPKKYRTLGFNRINSLFLDKGFLAR